MGGGLHCSNAHGHPVPRRLRGVLYCAVDQFGDPRHAAWQAGRRAVRAAGRAGPMPAVRVANAAVGVWQPASFRGDVWELARPGIGHPRRAGTRHAALSRVLQAQAREARAQRCRASRPGLGRQQASFGQRGLLVYAHACRRAVRACDAFARKPGHWPAARFACSPCAWVTAAPTLGRSRVRCHHHACDGAWCGVLSGRRACPDTDP